VRLTKSQGIRWWSIAALATAAIAPLAFIGILLERYIVKGLTASVVK
jgi:multiple sugar transport system permease protein